MEKITKEIIESCYNWLGYGNPNGYVWIVGKEEGTLEVDKKKKTPEESIKIRSTFQQVMDFGEVWQNLFGINLKEVAGKSQPWRFTARFLLALCGKKISDTAIDRFIIEEMGREKTDHFLAEYLPLPKKSVESIDWYRNFWSNVKDYWEEVRGIRFKKITGLMQKSSGLKLIISYDRIFSDKLVTEFRGSLIDSPWLSKNGRDWFQMYEINLQNRLVCLLATPFFGQGRICHDDVPKAVENVLSYLNSKSF